MGRPKKIDKRSRVLVIRMNEQEKMELDYVAKNLGMSRADTIRMLVNSKYRTLKWYER